ncbi:MAG: hypothetical protein M3010_08050 [Candidatus Dormibacteraeota bacterium]|nr:hypothetical protein [Candidatus Dormibacteraeota bacterium]
MSDAAAPARPAAVPRRRDTGLAWIDTRRLFLGAVLIALLVPALQPLTDPDYFWHVKVGQWILDHHDVPHHDLFTFTVPDHVFVTHEWLSEVIMAVLTRTGGPAAVSVFFGSVTWLGFLGLLASMRRVGYLVAGIALFVGVAAANPVLGPRTQMETFSLAIGLILLLRRYEDTSDRRWLYPIPLIFIPWVNLHAGFTIGLVFLAAAVVGRLATRLGARAQDVPPGPPARPLAAVLLLSATAVLVNPNTYRIYVYAAQTQFSPAQQRLIVEWFSPDFHDAHLLPFQLMLLLFLGLLAVGRRRPTATDLILLVGGTVLALHSVRHIALFVAVATPVLGEQAQGLWEDWRDRLPRVREPRPGTALGGLNLVVLAVVSLFVLATVTPAAGSGLRSPRVRQDYPVAAVDYLAPDPPPGHMFNQYGWGGYLTYRLWPGQKVFIYGDAAVMGDGFLNEFQSVEVIRPGYRDTLERRGVSWVIDSPAVPLLVALGETHQWVRVYSDKQATVLVHRTPQTQDWLARHGQP